MKKLLVCLFLTTVAGFAFPLQVNSQSYRSVEENITIEVKKAGSEEIAFTFCSGMERILITSSGNFLRTVTFTIDADNPIMNFPGPVRILEVKMSYDINGDGEAEIMADTMAVLTRSGKLMLVYHSNGAGKRLPPGWDF